MKDNLKKYIKKLIFIFKQIFKSNPLFLIFVILVVLVNGLSPVLTNFIIAKIISVLETSDIQSLSNQYNYLILLITFMLVSIVLALFTNGIKTIISELTSHRLTQNIQNMISERFQKIPQKTIDTPEFQNLYKITTENVLTAPMSVAETLFNLIACVTSMIGYIYILFTLNPFTVIFILGITIPLYFIKKRSLDLDFNFTDKYSTEYRQTYYDYALMSDEQFTKEIRTLNLFPYLKKNRDKMFEYLMSIRQKNARKKYLNLMFGTLLFLIGAFFSEYILISNLIKGKVPISRFVFYNTAITSLVSNLFTFVDFTILNNKSLRFLDYLVKFFEVQTEDVPVPSSYNNMSLDSNAATNKDYYEIEFSNVFFKYPGATKNNLENINFKFHTGERVCLVGENGSGKSTLVKLLLRIYEPTSGKILINGHDIRTYDITIYRKIFGIIFQDFIRYFKTVQENIGFGNTDELEDIEKIKRIAKITNSNDFIKKYEKGYQTDLGRLFFDEGIMPSGGQWQKLAISRAFFPDSKILVLDEPTASLDPKAEDEIFQMFHKHESNKAVFMVSHRMCSAKLADKIILLDDGKIAEYGSHNELMAKKDLYFEMYKLQADKYI